MEAEAEQRPLPEDSAVDPSEPLLLVSSGTSWHGAADAGSGSGGGLAYAIFFLLGLTMLYPWNAYITATDYYNSRLHDTPYHAYAENYFAACFQVVNLVGLCLTIFYQRRIGLHFRVTAPLLLLLVIFLLTAALVPMPASGETIFAVTMLCIAITAAMTALIQSSIFGLSGMLPPRYTQAVMSGQALGGLCVSLINVITIAAASTITAGAVAYFSTCAVVILASFLGFLVLLRLPIMRDAILAQAQRAGGGAGARRRCRDLTRAARPPRQGRRNRPCY